MLIEVLFSPCLFSSSFDVKAISKMAPKLRIIAAISKGVIYSLRKHHPSREAQNGAVLLIVFCTIKGMSVTLKVKSVKPVKPVKHRRTKTFLSSGLI